MAELHMGPDYTTPLCTLHHTTHMGPDYTTPAPPMHGLCSPLHAVLCFALECLYARGGGQVDVYIQEHRLGELEKWGPPVAGFFPKRAPTNSVTV